MTTIQPLLALFAALLCGILSPFEKGAKRFSRPNLWSLAGYGLLLTLACFCTFRLGKVDDHRAVILSLIAGGVVSVCSSCLSNFSFSVSAGLAVSGACLPHLVRADSFTEVGLAYGFSIAVGAVFLGSYPSVIAAAIIGAVVPMIDYLGTGTSHITSRAYTGVALGLAFCIASALCLSLRKLLPKMAGTFDSTAIAVLFAGAGYAVSRWSYGQDLWILLGLSAVGGLVVHWLLPSEREPDAMRVGIATVIWIALGTIGFSMLRGLGIAAAVIDGAFVLLMLGNSRAVLTLGPTIGLLMYRVLRDASPDSSRALDIGQHYGITGVVVGSFVPLLFADWYARYKPTRQMLEAVAYLLWGFVLISLPALSIVVLGSKGASGIEVGLGVSGFLVASRRSASALPMAIALAAGSANAVAVDWIGEAMDLSRHEKLVTFGWWTAAMVIAAIGILVVSRRSQVEAPQ